MRHKLCPCCGKEVVSDGGTFDPPDESFPYFTRHYCSAEALRDWVGTWRECICGASVRVQRGHKLNLDGTPHVCRAQAPQKAAPPKAAGKAASGRGVIPV